MTKQELEQKIEELQKRLDELKNVKVEEIKTKWKPNENEVYFYINNMLEVDYTNNINLGVDKEAMKIGNCYKTEEEAQFVADKIKYTLMFKHYVEEHSEPIDWENEEQEKWYIFLNTYTLQIAFGTDYNFKKQGTIYARSKQILIDAIAYLGKEIFVKYIL